MGTNGYWSLVGYFLGRCSNSPQDFVIDQYGDRRRLDERKSIRSAFEAQRPDARLSSGREVLVEFSDGMFALRAVAGSEDQCRHFAGATPSHPARNGRDVTGMAARTHE